MSRWLTVTAGVLRLGAGVTLAALALRVAHANVERSMRILEDQKQAESAQAKAAKDAKSGARFIPALPLSSTVPVPADLQKTGSSGRPASSRGKPTGVPPGSPIRMPVSVLVGPERSQVYVNRSKKGVTPFIGEIACKAGETVRVDVVPPQGMPLNFERPCEKRTLRLD